MFNNKFLKKDPLLEAVKQAQAEGEMRRAAEAIVNEEFGVYSRKAVIREQLAAYDAALESTYTELKEGKWEGSKEDKDEDAKLAKKHGMTLAQWEKSAADKKHDAKEKMDEAKLAKKDYDKDGKIESPKDEVWGSRLRAAKLAGKLKEGAVDAGSMEGSKSVTKSAPKEDPSTPKSYPGAASSLTPGNPTSQRMSNAVKENVTAPKEFKQNRGPNKGAITKVQGQQSIAEDEQLDELKQSTIRSYIDKAHARATAAKSAGFKKDYSEKKGKKAEKARGEFSKRTKGLGMAGMKLKEEQVEEAKYSAKAARAGADIGKPGKQFAKIAAKAGEKYGSEEKGKKVAGAILAKIRAKHMKEDNLQELSAFGKAFAAAGGKNFTFGGKEYSGARADQKSSVPTPPSKPAELKTPTTWKDPVSAGYDKPAPSSAPEPKAAPAPTMTTASPSTGAGTGVDTSVKSPSSGEKVNYSAPDVKAGQDKMKAMASLKESVNVGGKNYRIV